jgi:hypothetical protein
MDSVITIILTLAAIAFLSTIFQWRTRRADRREDRRED